MRMFLLYVCTVHNNARFIFAILRVRDFSAAVVKRVGGKIFRRVLIHAFHRTQTACFWRDEKCIHKYTYT